MKKGDARAPVMYPFGSNEARRALAAGSTVRDGEYFGKQMSVLFKFFWPHEDGKQFERCSISVSK